MNRTDFMIHLKRGKVKNEWALVKTTAKMGVPFFLIISSVFTFYHMVVVGIVQGNNAICGFNWGAGYYDRVKKSLQLALMSAFFLSVGLCYCSLKKAVLQALLLVRYKAVLLESSFRDSSACSFIYF